MQHTRAHIGQLAQLRVGYNAYYLGICDYSRVGYQKTAYVRPVFIKRRFYRLCDNRAGKVASAARERFYAAVGHSSVKPRDNGTGSPVKNCPKTGVCDISVEIALVVKENALGRVNKGIAEIFRENDSVKIFSAACGIVPSRAGGKIPPYFYKFVLKRQIYAKLAYYSVETFSYRRKGFREIRPAHDLVIAVVKHIRNLCIVTEAFSGG